MSEGVRVRSWVIAGLAAALLAALLIVALVRQPVQLDPNTPEGTVQTYLQALSDGDYEGAFNLLDPQSVAGCEAADLAAESQGRGFTATLGEVTATGDTAFVEVSIGRGSDPGPFDPGVSSFNQTFTLERVSGRWLIDGRAWPHFDWRCER